MCIIETKTYTQDDGTQRSIETTRRCSRAPAARLCSRVERRNVTQRRIVETRPSAEPSSSDGLLVTEGRDGRQRTYRDLSRRSNQRGSDMRRSNTTSGRSPADSPSTPSSSSSYVEVRPSVPTPPPAAPGFDVRRTPSYPPTLPPETTASIGSDGTAVYERPPSLEMPRARVNERPNTSRGVRRPSISSTTAEVDDDDEPTTASRPVERSRRPSLSVNTADIRRPNTMSSSGTSSPGLSSLPRVGSQRRDSTTRPSASNRPSMSEEDVRAREAARIAAAQRRSQQSREAQLQRQDDEERRQAQLDLNRAAARERARAAARQPVAPDDTPRPRARAASPQPRPAPRRPSPARETSDEYRERHRQQTAATLAGETATADRQARIDSELAQMARERAAAERRSLEQEAQQRADRRYADDQLRADEAARARFREARYNNSPSSSRPSSSRRTTLDSMTYATSPASGSRSPLSARSYNPSYGTVRIHQDASSGRDLVRPSSSRNSTTIRERGEDVIAREQARAEMEDLSLAEGFDDRVDVFDDDDDDDYTMDFRAEALRRRKSKRAQRDAGEADRRERRRDVYP